MQRLLFLMVGLLAGGAITYLPMSREYNAQQADLERRQREIKDELTRVQERARLSELVGKLGILLVKVEQKDYATARERSTKFFDSLRETQAAASEGKVKQALTKTLGQRDEITADLAMANDHVIPKLRDLFSGLQELLE